MGLRSFCTGTTSQPIFLFEFYHWIQPLTTGILKFNIPFIFDSARVGLCPASSSQSVLRSGRPRVGIPHRVPLLVPTPFVPVGHFPLTGGIGLSPQNPQRSRWRLCRLTEAACPLRVLSLGFVGAPFGSFSAPCSPDDPFPLWPHRAELARAEPLPYGKAPQKRRAAAGRPYGV